ncbi:hypothetical protein DICPUDRAFT_20552, partial [Dictyostelium purpureum]
DLDDLLNSALDELETQEKESPPVPPKLTTAVPTLTTTTTTTTTTTSTTTSNNVQNNNNNNNNNVKDNINLNGMMDMFKNLLDEDTLKQLNQDFDKGIKEEDLTEEDKKNIDDWAQKLSGVFNTEELNQYFENISQNSEFDTKDNNLEGGIGIDKFESNISETLKNLADNASNKAPDAGGLEEILSELSKMLENQGGFEGIGGDDKINDIFEESMEYMAKHYPQWIEDNKDKYSAEEIEKFKQQSELFTMLISKEGEQLDENLYTKMADLGNLPEAFCDEFLNKYETQIDKEK